MTPASTDNSSEESPPSGQDGSAAASTARVNTGMPEEENGETQSSNSSPTPVSQVNKYTNSAHLVGWWERFFGIHGTLGLTPNRNAKILLGLALATIVVGIGVGVGFAVSNKKSDDGSVKTKDSNTTWCGEGVSGNGVCENGLCCSPYGFCGFSEAHCVDGQTPPEDLEDPNRFCGDGFLGNQTCSNSTECCSPEGKCAYSYYACGYWPWNTTRGKPCGNGDIGDEICEDEDECCSQWGWCGTTEDHCAPWVEEETDNGGRTLRGTTTSSSSNSSSQAKGTERWIIDKL